MRPSFGPIHLVKDRRKKPGAAMKQLMRIVCCASTVLLMLTSARAQYTDQDRRAAATLYSGYAGKLITPDTITDNKIKPGLTRVEKNAEKKSSLFSLDYGGVKDGVDTRGYMRVTINDEL